MSLATRTSRIGESATLAVARRADELRRQGADVLDLGPGEPDFPSPAAAVERARRALAEGFTKYTQGSGMPELRQALAETYRRRWGAPWSAADTVVTVGGKAALFELALALFEPGSEVVLPSPYWVTFPEHIAFTGARAVVVPTSPDDGFRLHAEPLLAAMTERTRAVLINFPSNPAGGVIGEDDLRRLAAGCAEHGVVLIADETYERFLYDGARPVSAAAFAAELPRTVVVVSSFSKTYAMTGWRVGYLLGPPEVVGAVAAIQSHATSNPTSFAMAGALAALEEPEVETEVEAMIAEYQARRDLLIPRLAALPGFSCRPPEGAFYAFPHVAGAYREGRQGSLAFAEFLLEEARVAVVPGVAFGMDEHIRLSFATSRETLAAALDRMATALGS